MHSLISAFVTRLLESFISRLAMTELSIFKLVSVDEQTGLNLTFSKTQKKGFVVTKPKLHALLFRLSTILLKDLNNYEKNISTVSMKVEKSYRLRVSHRKLFRPLNNLKQRLFRKRENQQY